MFSLDAISRIAERKIQEGIEEGKFDNLPGKGKPIVFDDDPATPAHLRLANRILKNANVLPDWIQFQKDIVSERQQVIALSGKLVSENAKWKTRMESTPENSALAERYASWHTKSRTSYLKLLKNVNDSILKYSLIAPSTAEPFRSYKIQDEMAGLDADFPSHSAHPVGSELESREESVRRILTRTLYKQSIDSMGG